MEVIIEQLVDDEGTDTSRSIGDDRWIGELLDQFLQVICDGFRLFMIIRDVRIATVDIVDEIAPIQVGLSAISPCTTTVYKPFIVAKPKLATV